MKLLFFLAPLIICLSCQNKKEKGSASIDKNSADTTSLKPGDKSISDLSNRFTVSYTPASGSSNQISDMQLAVIPVDSLGTVDIKWHQLKQESTKETEKEFETELLQCIDGKDKSGQPDAVTTKRKSYCERVGYSDGGGMGSYAIMHYGAFVKDNNLVIAEFFVNYSKCNIGYEEKSQKAACESENEKKRQAIDNFMENLAATARVRRI